MSSVMAGSARRGRTRRGRAAIAVLTATALVTLAGPSARAAAPGVNGAVAFFRSDSQAVGIFTKAPAQQAVERVDLQGWWVDGLAWSPDGSRIAYDVQGTFPNPIDVVDADGGNQHPVVSFQNAVPKWPSWKPDGSQILFTKATFTQSDTREDLWVVNANGSNPHVLVSTPSFDEENASWSPSGSWISFESPDPNTGHQRLYVMKPDGTGRRLLGNGYGASWAPDGSRIAFANRDIFTIRPDGTGLHRVTYVRGGNETAEPGWSPDGSSIVLQETRTSGVRIDTVDLDGSTLVPFSDGTSDHIPDWQPLARPPASADLAVGQSVASHPFVTNSNVTFTVSVRDLGPAVATDVVVTDHLPPGTTLVSATGTGLSCQGTGPVACTANTLAAGPAAKLTLVVRSAHPGILRNVATADASTADPVPSNDGADGVAAVRAPGPAAPSDFNGDGRPDLAVTSEEPRYGAGAVTVAPGTANGIDPDAATYASDLYPYSWGWSVATGDFDGDGFTDLAGGAPQAYRGINVVGAVGVLYGSARGLDRDSWQFMDEATPGIDATPKQFEVFGNAVAAGDFNGDGRDDLAVGAWREARSGATGYVYVIPGSPSGLQPSKTKEFSGITPGLPGTATDATYFGFSLAAGDFDGDHRSDLAIGTLSGGSGPGAVYVLQGSASGLTTNGARRFDEDTPGIPSDLAGEEQFGFAVAAGDFGKGRRVDLAVGAPGEDGQRGAVFVLFGTNTGITATGAQKLSLATPGMAGANTRDAGFGISLAAGNMNGAGPRDLSVGVQYGGGPGAVNVLYGGTKGLKAQGSRQFQQGVGGVPGTGSRTAYFGSTLAVLDVGHGGQADLVAAASDETIGHASGAGTITILYGSTSGVTATGAKRDTAADFGDPMDVEYDGRFGIGLG